MLQSIEKYTPLLRVMGFLCFCVSAFFTVKLLYSLGNDTPESVAFGVFGLCAQGSQNILPVIGAYRTGIAKPLCFAAFVCLFILSLIGTFGNFIKSHSTKVVLESSQDAVLAQMKADMKLLDSQLKAHDRAIRDYTKRSIITRGAKPEAARKEVTLQKRMELSEQMRSYTPPATLANSFYSGVASVASFIFGTSVSTNAAMLGVFAAYAVMLDVLGALLIYLTVSSEVEQERTSKNKAYKSKLYAEPANA